MASNQMGERGKALETVFFHSEDAKLLDKLRLENTREALTAASGITDQKALDALINSGVTASTLTAMTAVPVIFVAWADRMMNERESKAVLKAAVQAGIEKGSEAYGLIEGWLENRPPKALLEAWEQYIESAISTLDAADKEQLRRATVEPARKVAEATGGFLGVATVSAVEREVLAKIDQAFS